MNKTTEVLFALLRSAIIGTNETVDLSGVDYNSLISLAKFHDLAHILYYELERRGELPTGEVAKGFKEQYSMALFRHAKRDVTIEQIRGILNGANVPFVLLKGVVMMNLYPESWMRTSSDVDVLIRESDNDIVNDLLKCNGMNRISEYIHEVSFSSDCGYHIEIHDSLIEDTNNANSVLRQVWDYVEAKQDGNTEMSLRDEFYYFYHIAHMAQHFRNGGCGIRPFIDLWILNHIQPFDKDKRDALMIRGGLQPFEQNARRLSEVWFSGEKRDNLLDVFEKYIIDGGIYGTLGQSVSIRKKEANGRIKYYLSRIFPRYDLMKHKYTVLKKNPVLLPFCWFVR